MLLIYRTKVILNSFGQQNSDTYYIRKIGEHKCMYWPAGAQEQNKKNAKNSRKMKCNSQFKSIWLCNNTKGRLNANATKLPPDPCYKSLAKIWYTALNSVKYELTLDRHHFQTILGNTNIWQVSEALDGSYSNHRTMGKGKAYWHPSPTPHKAGALCTEYAL